MEKTDRSTHIYDSAGNGGQVTDVEFFCRVADKLDEIVEWINEQTSQKGPMKIDEGDLKKVF